MNRIIQVSKVARLNLSTYRKDEFPEVIQYLDTSSLTKNKIESFQILNSNIDTIPSRAQRKIKLNTILFSTVRPNQEHYGIIEKELRDTVVSTGFTTIDVTDIDINPKYLFYLLTQPHITEYLHTIATNSVSAYPSILPDDIGNLKFRIPELPTQQKIASVLSSLDSKIELNNRINAELEAMAKTLYDYWFVQFDFPDKNGKPYKTSGGKMVWNEELKREIPEGWEVDIIDAVLSALTKGLTTEYVEKSNLINLNQKVNKGFSLERQYFKYLDESIPIPEEKYAREKDILINSLGQGTLGRVHFFCEKVKNIVVDQHLFILRTNEKKVKAIYLYLLLTSKAYQIQIDRQITGSTGMQMLNASNLKDINIIIPNLEIMRQFEKSVYPFFEKIVVNELENQKLTELRDWLLPMLMNGQVKVS